MRTLYKHAELVAQKAASVAWPQQTGHEVKPATSDALAAGADQGPANEAGGSTEIEDIPAREDVMCTDLQLSQEDAVATA
eukprot:568031-Pleurochrysis_carterae.AAC.1